jgi:hypothetical protein
MDPDPGMPGAALRRRARTGPQEAPAPILPGETVRERQLLDTRFSVALRRGEAHALAPIQDGAVAMASAGPMAVINRT